MFQSIVLSQRKVGRYSSIMDDAEGEDSCFFQETGQEQRPARMVGLYVLILPKLAGSWLRVAKIQTGTKEGQE